MYIYFFLSTLFTHKYLFIDPFVVCIHKKNWAHQNIVICKLNLFFLIKSEIKKTKMYTPNYAMYSRNSKAFLAAKCAVSFFYIYFPYTIKCSAATIWNETNERPRTVYNQFCADENDNTSERCVMQNRLTRMQSVWRMMRWCGTRFIWFYAVPCQHKNPW